MAPEQRGQSRSNENGWAVVLPQRRQDEPAQQASDAGEPGDRGFGRVALNQ